MILVFGRRLDCPTRGELDLAAACWTSAEGSTLERDTLEVFACPDLLADDTEESEDAPVSAEATEAAAIAIPAPTPSATARPPTRPI